MDIYFAEELCWVNANSNANANSNSNSNSLLHPEMKNLDVKIEI